MVWNSQISNEQALAKIMMGAQAEKQIKFSWVIFQTEYNYAIAADVNVHENIQSINPQGINCLQIMP